MAKNKTKPTKARRSKTRPSCEARETHDGQGCLYIKKLDDVDRDVLRMLVRKAVKSASAP